MTRRVIFGVGVLCTLFVTAAWSPAVHAQSFVDIVWRQLTRTYEQVRGDGYSTKNYIIGALDEDAKETWTLNFFGGNTYTVRGVCDGDCDDIDLRILRDGQVIGSDTLSDEFPIVTFDVARNGRYDIEVTMYDCSNEPCYFGLGVFFK